MINGYNRTAYCGEFNESHIGQEAVVFGWAQKTRDLGNLIFIDLRDRSGILQLAFGDGTEKEVFEKAASVRAEFVLEAKGVIRRRESVNTEIPTGAVELFVTELFILAKSQTPPFEVSDNCNAKEDLRLKYRYLDLRRGEMQNVLMMRHKIVKSARDYYDENGFMEIETPDLIKSTPEGARDYLVPSRVHPGCFYALPQSPQLYKQLLMMSGCDRYMQIARCFRDEDLRADRQPEFTQIDMEMSFVDENDVMTLNEGLVKRVFKDVLNYDVPTPFERLTYNEAMARFGSDKPDTRFGLELCDLSDLLTNCEFKVFAGALEKGSVRAINAKGAASVFTRKEIDKLVEVVKLYKAKGLAWTRLTADGETSSYEKFLTEEEKTAIRERLGAETGDVLFIVADSRNDIVFDALGALRLELGKRLDLIPKGTYNFLWVTDFPLFEWSDEENRWMAKHHPFTCPRFGDEDKLMTDPGDCYARAYDMVLNGCELGGGSIRISDTEVQDKMLQALGLSEEVAQARFGFLLDAEKYGVPPHGGMAFGLDRMVMLMLDRPSIRDVIAFPKVQTASELMTQCPTEVDQKNLDELHIAVIKNEE
ncbi:MAG: aspartate--tRNA ligase [Oscillospiraceae bacterium]|nr:aspartate--tRNA ligase [Oscillospiraceae bacterium]